MQYNQEVDVISFCKHKKDKPPEEYLFKMLELLGSDRQWDEYQVEHQTASSIRFRYIKDNTWAQL